MTPTAERFWSKVERRGPDDCWPFRNGLPDRYGRFWLNGNQRAHRIAFELTHGEVPEGSVVMHRCDFKPCCNPRHLQAGTQQENTRQMFERGLDNRASGSRAHKAKLHEALIPAIRERLAHGELQREIAAQYDVTQTTISRIKLLQTWRPS